MSEISFNESYVQIQAINGRVQEAEKAKDWGPAVGPFRWRQSEAEEGTIPSRENPAASRENPAAEAVRRCPLRFTPAQKLCL
jgi:hypothetical protein